MLINPLVHVMALRSDSNTLCDDRNWFASVCIKHGVFQSRRSKRVTCCAAQAFNFNKRDDFSIVARFRVLITAAMST